MRTNDLIGEPLNWAVGKCVLSEDELFVHPDFSYVGYKMGRFSPSTDWNQGGAIIAKEGIHILCDDAILNWTASAAPTYSNGRRLVGWRTLANGPTPLVAAMRCFVASKLGEDVDVPEELLP